MERQVILVRLWVALAIALASALPLRAGERQAEGRVAIITGGAESPPDVLVAQLEAALSQVKGVSLVERSQVRKILDEQKLSASGLVDPRTAVKVGKLLAADILLCMESVEVSAAPAEQQPKPEASPRSIPPEVLKRLSPEIRNKLAQQQATQPPPSAPSSPDGPVSAAIGGGKFCRLLAVEARTGVVLSGLVAQQQDLAADVSPGVARVRLALAKLRADEKDRRYLAVMSFRSEEPGWALDGTAAALGMFLVADLGNSPDIVMLERKDVLRLQAEKDLTGQELSMRSAALLAEGGVRRVPGKPKYSVTIKLGSLGGAATEPIVLEVPADDMATLRRELSGAVLARVKARKPDPVGADANREAALFEQHAVMLSAHGESEAAASAMEAAMALSPSPERRLKLIAAWLDVSRSLLAVKYFVDGGPEFPKELKPTVFRAEVRAQELRRQALDGIFASLKSSKEPSGNPPGPAGPDAGGSQATGLRQVVARPGSSTPTPFTPVIGWADTSLVAIQAARLPLAADETEARQLRRDLRELRVATYRTLLERCAQRWDCDHARVAWYSAVQSLPLPGIWDEDPQEWAKLFREAVTALTTSVPRGESWKHWVGSFFTLHIQDLQGAMARPCFDSAEGRDVVRKELARLRDHKEPMIRLRAVSAAYTLLGDAGAAEGFLSALAKGLPPEESIRALSLETLNALKVVEQGRGAAAADALCAAIIEPHVRNHSAQGLYEVSLLVEHRMGILERLAKHDEASQWAKSVIEAAQKAADEIKDQPRSPSVWYTQNTLRNLIRFMETKRARYAGTTAQETAEGLEGYELVEVDYGSPPPGCNTLAAMEAREGRVVTVWSGDITKDWMCLAAVEASPDWRAKRLIGVTAVERSVFTGLQEVRALAVAGQAAYVGTINGGLIAFADGKAKVWTEKDGLPGKGILCAAGLGDKVYFGTGRPERSPEGVVAQGSVVEFDPAKGTFTILASARSQSGKGGLDGGTVPYSTCAMLADSQRKCLWIAVVDESRKSLERSGVWKYDVGKGAFEHVLKGAGSRTGLAWEGGKIAYGNVLLDPDTGQQVSAQPQAKATPKLILGKLLPQSLFRAVAFAATVDNAVIAGTRSGQFWIARPTASGQPPESRPKQGQVVDLLSGEEVAAADIERTKDFGCHAAKLVENGLAQRSGVLAGDIILAIDGLRICGVEEYNLAKVRGLPKDSMDLTINRGGTIIERRIIGVQARDWRRLGIRLDRPAGFARETLRDLGISLQGPALVDADLMPTRALCLLRTWLNESGENRNRAGWIKGFLELHSALVNQEYVNAKAPEQASPIPFFNRLAKFYLAVARFHAKGERPLDWRAYGENADFCALYYPWPKFVPPPLGTPSRSDEEFVKALGLMREDVVGNAERLAALGSSIRFRGGAGNDTDTYINMVKGAVVYRKTHGGWPFRCELVFYPDGRAKIVKELTSRHDKRDGEAPVYALCLLAPKVMDGDTKTVIALLDELRKDSPFLAMLGLVVVSDAASYHDKSGLLQQVSEHAWGYDWQMAPKPTELYRWCVQRNPYLLNGLAGGPFAAIDAEMPPFVRGAAHWLSCEPAQVKAVLEYCTPGASSFSAPGVR